MPVPRQSFANSNSTTLLLGEESSRARHRAILMDHLHQQASPGPYTRWLADKAGKKPAIQTNGKNIKDPVALLVSPVFSHSCTIPT